MDSPMRLFVAVRLDEGVIEAAVTTSREMQRQIGSHVDARWVRAQDMHLTVRFIGAVAAERAAMVLDAMRSPLLIPPFDVALGECGIFPPHGAPRVLWIGLASGLESLRAMHHELNRRLAPLGYEPEAREFSAHLTLARIKDIRGTPRSLRAAVASIHPPPAGGRVSAATVFRSHPSPKGSTYESLFDIPCKG